MERAEGYAAVFQHGDLALLQKVIVLCVFDNRRHIGRDKHLALSLRDDQRAFAANGVNGFGTVGKNDTQRERAAKLVKHLADAADRVAVVVEVEQLSHDFGVGVRQELIALVIDQKLL